MQRTAESPRESSEPSIVIGESYPRPQFCVHEAFEHVAERHPERIALEQDEHRLTYAELNRRSNQVAHWLRHRGVGPGDLVALCAPPSIDTLVALLAVQKSGAGYLAIDPAYSIARIRQVIESALPKVALLDPGHVPREVVMSCESTVATFAVASALGAAASMNEANLAVPDLLKHVAYVMYTSGSTGTPKGVMVPHSGVANLVAAMVRRWPITAETRMLQFASMDFDASVPEWAGPLSVGGTVVLKPRNAMLLGDDLIDLVKRKGITLFKMPASALRVVTRQPLPQVRTIVTAGDACTAELVTFWAEGRRFFNCYGPTEVSIGSTMSQLTPTSGPVTIGRPNANLRGYVLDEHRQPVAVGEVGELYMAGVGVTWGYLGQAGMTAARFLPDLSGDAGARMYRTGDCVRLLPTGELQFLGRVDEQVKVRGFRIEPSEIEHALLQLDGVEQAAVVALSERGSEPFLVGFVCADADWTGERLRDALQESLPTYMVPARWYRLAQLPLTINGKVDRSALRDCPGERIEAVTTPVTDDPTALERDVAALWSQYLETPVGLSDSFTSLGGDSLLAVRVSQQLRHQLGLAISAAELVQARGVRALLQHMSLHADPEAAGIGIEAMDEAALDRILADLEHAMTDRR